MRPLRFLPRSNALPSASAQPAPPAAGAPASATRGGAARAAAKLVGLAAAALVIASAGPAAADAPKDAEARNALAEALDVDYLETRFDRAEERLRQAIESCGDGGCTPALKAKLYAALGAVLAGGKKQLEDARDAFVAALELDPDAKPDPDVLSTEVQYAFDQAKKLAKGSGAPAPAASSSLEHTPPSEQRVGVPVPLFVKLDADKLAKAKKVTVRYRAPGASSWKALPMKKVGERGFGANVPCGDVETEGALRYHILVEDEGGNTIASAGSEGSPFVTTLRKSISGEGPRWPGFAPPEPCGKPRETTLQCIDDRECNVGLACIAGVCEKRPDDADDEKKAESKNNWVLLSFTPDVSILSGTDVCTPETQTNENYVCYRQDGTRYEGNPEPGVGNNIKTGAALSTMRVMLGYDRVLIDNLTIGARVGFAFGGATEGGAKFLPVYLEARGAYYLGSQPFARAGVRPFFFISGGLAQVDTGVEVEIREQCAKGDDDCKARDEALTAYKQAGLGFVGAGVGLSYAPIQALSLNVSVRGAATLPVVTAVISPEVGISIGF